MINKKDMIVFGSLLYQELELRSLRESNYRGSISYYATA